MSVLAIALVVGGALALAFLAASSMRYRRVAARHDGARRRLAALALDAETREQRRLSETLHDTALQTLAAARQDVAEALGGNDESLRRAAAGLDSAIDEVRRVVSDLHPMVAEQLGVGPALRAVALDHGRRRGFQVDIEAEREAAGSDDRVLLFLARELIANVGAHSGATRAAIRLTRELDHVVLEVADDGCGFDEATRLQALRNGHIGLAACKERVEALGGAFTLTTAPGSGTRVRIALPVDRERRRFTRPEVPAGRPSPALR